MDKKEVREILKKHYKTIAACHIYSQQYWHTDSFIVLNERALFKLYKVLGELVNSLKNGKTLDESEIKNKDVLFFQSDGEGYRLNIICTNSVDIWNNLANAYVEDIAKETREHAIYPHEIIKEENQKE